METTICLSLTVNNGIVWKTPHQFILLLEKLLIGFGGFDGYEHVKNLSSDLKGKSKETSVCYNKNMPIPTILVVGDVMLDRYISGAVTRVSPEAPVPVVLFASESHSLGGAANLAANIVAGGANAILAGNIGKSGGHLDKFLQLVSDCGIQILPLCAKGSLIVKERIVDLSGAHICRIDYEDTPLFLDSYEVSNAIGTISHIISRVNAVVFSDYDKGLLSKSLVQGILDLLRQRKLDIPVFVDGKKDPSIFQNCFLIKPNIHELSAWTGCRIQSKEDLFSAMHSLASSTGIPNIVCTLGQKGVAALTEGKRTILPSVARSVFDVSGAGDTFLAHLVCNYCLGGNLLDSIAFGNKAAGFAVSKRGTSIVSREEALVSINKTVKSDFSAFSLQRSNQKIVFTNGCFDVLHPGHLHLLEKAKSLGDLLVIGINSDASIQRLKGPSRPINPLSFRMKMLEGLSCVDFVFPFDEDTPIELIKRIRPNVLVKGGDYEASSVVGDEFVRSYGGKTFIIPLLNGYSSTSLIKKIKES